MAKPPKRAKPKDKPDRSSDAEDSARTRSGTEAAPRSAQTIAEHTTESESGYGGKHASPRVSADQKNG